MCGFSVLPTDNVGSSSLWDPVNRKKVLNFPQNVHLHFGVAFDTAKPRIASHASKNLLVLHSMIHNFKKADRSDAANASGKCRVITQHKDVKGIAAYTGSLRDETVTARIMNWEMNWLDGMKRLRTSIVLRDSAVRSFDNRSNDVRCVLA
jgi:hypothetical protein